MARFQHNDEILEEEPCDWNREAGAAAMAHHAVQVTAIGILDREADKVLGADNRLWLHDVRMMTDTASTSRQSGAYSRIAHTR